MRRRFFILKIFIGFHLTTMLLFGQKAGVKPMRWIDEEKVQKTMRTLIEKYEEADQARIERGVRQVASLWFEEDGSRESFNQFCQNYFLVDSEMTQKTLDRYEKNLETVHGHFLEIYRGFLEPMHLDVGSMLPVDYQFAQYSPWTHLTEDLFKIKVAFTALLNFPLTSLEERLEQGSSWSRIKWVQSRLVEQFAARVPPPISQEINQVYVLADDYISNYNIYMHHVLDPSGNRLFPKGLKLISHWGLRDELKAQYAEPDGLVRQEMIQKIMERIVRQEIPRIVINNPAVDWIPESNRVNQSMVRDIEGGVLREPINDEREPDIRYEHLLHIFQSEKKSDPYYPITKTLIDRRFQRDREIPEKRVRALFEAVLTSPEIMKTSKLIEKRLGRSLKPFDIWYRGFKSGGQYPESKLDSLVAQRYSDIDSFDKDIPALLQKLGFDAETARFLGSKIKVDPARGAGHALGAEHRSDHAHLRTRIPPEGMNYKGFNIACHELGHNCEQVLSLNRIDHTLLHGVPNTAFTEAFAFVFQSRDLELLNLTDEDPLKNHFKALDVLWSTYEIGGVSLVDMNVWHWLYNHSTATPAELREAVIQISKEIWNTYFAPIFGVRDVILLGVYSHMIDGGLYLPNYPLGFIIQVQIEQHLQGKVLGKEMERLCRLGNIGPDLWMQTAVGESISSEPLLKAAREAIRAVNHEQ